MICKNCGAEIGIGLSECEFCGTQIDTTNLKTESTATQSMVSLLSFEEKQRLSLLMTNGNLVEAQKLVMNAFGFNGPQAYEIVNQIVKYKDAVIPDLDMMIKNLTSKSKGVLFFDETDESMSKAKAGAQNKYLFKQGYVTDEKILLLYDNAILKAGESGFTITDKRFYSSGSFLGDKAFSIPLQEVKTTRIDGNNLLINDRKVDIVLVDANDYLKVCAIVSRIIRSNR